MALVFWLLSGALVATLWFLWSRRRFYKIWWELPGPLGLPFIGVGLHMMDPTKFLQYMAQELKQLKSPLISWMGTNCFLYVSDPETVKAVFNSPNCTNKGHFYSFISFAIGDGLFTSSSPRWNKHRRLINPTFSRQVLQDFMCIFNAEGDALIRKLEKESANGSKLEMYEVLKRSVLEIACQTTMGKKMNFQNNGSAAIFEAYNGVTEVCVRRMLSPWLYPETLYRRSSLYAHQKRVVGVLYDFVESLLQRSNDKPTATPPPLKPTNNDDNNNEQESCLRKSKAIFVEQVRKYVEQGQLSWEDVRDEANVIIAATFETTSTAFYTVCLCLAMHPDCQEKLYDELLELFPNGNEGELSSSSKMQVTNEHLERMTYAEMVINESMRLFAPVPMVLRSAAADFELTVGMKSVVIPQGTQIGIDIFNMQRSERVWGPQALHFQPELNFGPEAAATQSPFAFVPFTAGLRMCIGNRYALMLIKVMLAKICRHFRLHTDTQLQDLRVKGTISLKFQEYPLFELLPR